MTRCPRIETCALFWKCSGCPPSCATTRAPHMPARPWRALLLLVAAAAAAPAGPAAERLLLQHGYTETGCKGDPIPITLGRFDVCGPVGRYAGVFKVANDTNISLSVYNGTRCAGPLFEQRTVGVGECRGGSFEYAFADAVPADTCVLWGCVSARAHFLLRRSGLIPAGTRSTDILLPAAPTPPPSAAPSRVAERSACRRRPSSSRPSPSPPATAGSTSRSPSAPRPQST